MWESKDVRLLEITGYQTTRISIGREITILMATLVATFLFDLLNKVTQHDNMKCITIKIIFHVSFMSIHCTLYIQLSLNMH